MLRFTKPTLLKGGIALALFIGILMAIVWNSKRRKAAEQEQLLKDQEEQIKALQEGQQEEALREQPLETNQNSEELDSLHKRVDELEYLIRPIQKLNEEAVDKRKRQASKAEQLAWEEAKRLKTIEGYQSFLAQTFQTKVFRGIATRRLNELQRS